MTGEFPSVVTKLSSYYDRLTIEAKGVNSNAFTQIYG